ncbi:MAG: hypothetical protein LC722_08375 [Actinobacteria bacterium]|nr:hypothetical protein [Actinomycetota bacterium]
MRYLVMAGGAAGTAAAWRWVARGGSIWRATAVLFAVLGVASVALGGAAWGSRVEWPWLLGIGVGSALWGATRAFLAIAGRWAAFARHTSDLYDQRRCGPA